MDQAKKFAEDTGVSEALAKKIIAALYAKGLDADDFGVVLYRIECMIKDQKLMDLVNATSDEEIQKIVDMLAVQEDYENGAWCSEKTQRSARNADVWLFSDLQALFAESKEFQAGDRVKIQIMRVGHWDHPMYGEVEVTAKTLRDVKKNFDENKRGIELCVDENHEENHRALGWYRELQIDGNDLYAEIELNTAGAKMLTEGYYKYFSPELVFKKTDEESGQTIENLLIGGAFTNRPFFKGMQPLMATENASENHQGDKENNLFLFFTDSPNMKKFLELVAQFTAKNALDASEIQTLEKAFSEIQNPDEASRTILANMKAKFSEKTEDQGDKNKNGVVLKANEMIVNAEAFAALKLGMEQGIQATARLNEMEIDSSVEKFTITEGNKSGRFHDSQKEPLKAFLISLNADQRKAFAEIVAGMPKVNFSENGTGNAGNALSSADVREQLSHKIALKLSEAATAGKSLNYAEAATQVYGENPDLHKRYLELTIADDE